MTHRKDFKRRVRDRQQRTGESYVTARRHVEAQADSDDKPAPASAIEVVESVDATDEARRLGFESRVLIFPALLERIELVALLERVREALIASEGDRDGEYLRRIALLGEPPSKPTIPSLATVDELRRFMQRARAGIGGSAAGGRLLVMHVAGRGGGIVPVLCHAWPTRPAALLVTMVGDFAFDVLDIFPR